MPRSNEEFNGPTVRTGDILGGRRTTGHEERWTAISRPTGEAAVAKLTGGYDMPRSRDYTAFPEGQAQGELFNLKTPRIEGWYKTEGASAADAMNVLGVAAKESKKRYGSYPQPDDTLSKDSAAVVSKLVGKEVAPTYNTHLARWERASEGDSMANIIVDKMDISEDSGRVPVKRHTEEDLTEGRNLVRTMIASRRGKKTKTPKTATNPSAVKGKQFPGPEHPTLPGL